jgi:hypothetical protein
VSLIFALFISLSSHAGQQQRIQFDEATPATNEALEVFLQEADKIKPNGRLLAELSNELTSDQRVYAAQLLLEREISALERKALFSAQKLGAFSAYQELSIKESLKDAGFSQAEADLLLKYRLISSSRL